MESDHEAVPPKGVSDRLKIHAARVKQHLQDNKTTYLVGAGCLAAGYFLRSSRTTVSMGPVFNNTVAPSIAPVIEIVNTVNNGGYARKIIRCLETGEMWPSMKAAAEATGNTLHAMSRHCNGHLEALQDLHYTIDALAAG